MLFMNRHAVYFQKAFVAFGIFNLINQLWKSWFNWRRRGMHLLRLQDSRCDLASHIFIWTDKDIDWHISGRLIRMLSFHVRQLD